MPIIDTQVRGQVDVQADGSRRGTIDFTFDDSRIITKTVRAPDASAWANLLVDLPAQIEKQIQEQDAEEASETDDEIVGVKQANIKQVALAYLRKAYAIGNPYKAYLKFSRFNDYRLAQGWNLNQVVTGLMEVGLTEEEWTDMKDRYVYLSQSARVTAMEAYQSVLAGDTWGEENR